MFQFYLDTIEQMDLALDQLALNDKSFNRFAIMLIDNVVELTLHKFAQHKELYSRYEPPSEKERTLIANALGPRFDEKVKLAEAQEFIAAETAESFRYLHRFRNTAYHQGLKHEGILRSVALFYFQNACDLFGKAPDFMGCSSDSRTEMSYRALKHIGKINGDHKFILAQTWLRLKKVASSIGDNLIEDLCRDMEATITATNAEMEFEIQNSSEPITREELAVNAQAWALAFTDEGKAMRKRKGTLRNRLKIILTGL